MIKKIYKIFRSLLFSATILIVAFYVFIYILLAAPPFQDYIKNIAEKELSQFLEGEIKIGNLKILPFNEIVIKDLALYDTEGNECAEIETLGAGINLFTLLRESKFDISYAEVIGMNARITQKYEDSPLNIQFLIDAFSPKNDNKEKKKFNLSLRNVVLRKCSASFDKEWIPLEENQNKIDLNHIQIKELRADLLAPYVTQDSISVDLRRLSFEESNGLKVDKLAFKFLYSPESMSLSGFVLRLPSSVIHLKDINLNYKNISEIKNAFYDQNHTIEIFNSKINPSDLAFLLPELTNFYEELDFYLKASGNEKRLKLENLSLVNPLFLDLKVSGEGFDIIDTDHNKFKLDDLNIWISSRLVSQSLSLFDKIPQSIKTGLSNSGNIQLKANGEVTSGFKDYKAELQLISDPVELYLNSDTKIIGKKSIVTNSELTIEKCRLLNLFTKSPVENFKGNILFDGVLSKNDIDGSANIDIEEVELKSGKYEGFALNITKNEEFIDMNFIMDNAIGFITSSAEAHISSEEKSGNLNFQINDLKPALIFENEKFSGYQLDGDINADFSVLKNSITKVDFNLRDLSLHDSKKELQLSKLNLQFDKEEREQTITLGSDWVDAEVNGNFNYKDIWPCLNNLAYEVFPSFITPRSITDLENTNIDFDILIKDDNQIPEFFNLPIRLLVPIPVSGYISSEEQKAELSVNIPYLQQGKDKLISDSRIDISLDSGESEFRIDAGSTIPVKNGEVNLSFSSSGNENKILSEFEWINPENSKFSGLVSLFTSLNRNPLSNKPDINLIINPSEVSMGEALWNIDRCRINYSEESLSIDNLKLWRDAQFVDISGVASSSEEDMISVKLQDIDVDYIFDTLKINYVTFGGTATGNIFGRSLFSKHPIAETNDLFIESLSYNGAVLGDAEITSKWNNDEKEVEINADISHDNHHRVKASGGVWVTRDSLNFDIDASKVPVQFIQPFMQVFSSDVGGFASGQVKLGGTFKDIDLTGKIFADSVSIKLDYTNTYYHGSDSVFLNPGSIEIPSFRLYDRNGNSALLTGEVKHHYFHEPVFNFRVSDARDLLCYDTSDSFNPDWYGVLYGNGGAVVRGYPGVVEISVDMSIVGNSSFTFVLNETQAAEDYHFLSFSDKRKEEEMKKQHIEKDIKAEFRKRIKKNAESPSRFGIDIRASVTPSVLFTLVMDPIAGDKITARGSGAIQVEYNSPDDQMLMYGKYTIEEGNYNFSLQDLILRDFKILDGSSISFNGNPLAADLDIRAAYRVNTNLSDLDKSFSSDRDLARTNVPVDAILIVEGAMQQPDITFDIELPTLTQDVERKVKSIISTDDMMNRQIIYLLALNRFYTPEYMGSSSNGGGELAAVASTTLSSQLSNMLSQLTDKVTVSPSFRSDKGDFSDLEVDVALSSRLLNNRLLINGNFGYRDRSSSSTTFVGDFDIEYLLSKGGNLRLKAYNHFNDHNYYLREALTTQGLGVIYRKDFDNPFTFLKKKKKKDDDEEKVEIPENAEKDSESLKDHDGNSQNSENEGRPDEKTEK